MRVHLYVGEATVEVEAPATDAGRRLVWRLRAAMVATEAAGQVISQAPAVQERLYASPSAGETTLQLSERVRTWLRRAGHEVDE